MDRTRASRRQAVCQQHLQQHHTAEFDSVPVLWSRELLETRQNSSTFQNEKPFAVRHFQRYLPLLPERSGMSSVGGCEACTSCAVVGASGSLLRAQHGSAIDSHAVVLRPNWLKLSGYEAHVGRRTTYNVIFALENMLDQFLRSQRKLPPSQRAIGLATPSSPRGMNSYFRYLGRRQNNLSHPTSGPSRAREQPLYLLSDLLWRHALQHLCAATEGGCHWPARTATMRPSSGFFAVLVALQSCRNVSLFGFTSDACLPFHYYGTRQAQCAVGKPHKMAVPKENDEHVHWFDKEHEIYAAWERRGLLRVFS